MTLNPDAMTSTVAPCAVPGLVASMAKAFAAAGGGDALEMVLPWLTRPNFPLVQYGMKNMIGQRREYSVGRSVLFLFSSDSLRLSPKGATQLG
jgi:hypothetical protein